MQSRRTRLLLGAVAILVACAVICVWSLSRSSSPSQPVDPEDHAPPQGEQVESPNASLPRVERTQVAEAVIAPRSATVWFVDDRGSALPRARLALVDNGIERVVGSADENAGLGLDAATIEGKDCLARADEHKPAWVHMPAHIETATIVLERLAVISGTVSLVDGSHPDDVFHVIAYEDKCRPLCDEIARPAEAKLMRCTTTDSAGYFSIAGLDPQRQYTLSGASRGYVLDGPVEHVPPGTRDVQLTALPLYGIRLVVQDNEGQPLKLSPDLFSMNGGGFMLMDRSAKDCGLMNELVLAKVDGVDCVEKEDRDAFVLIYSSQFEKESVGPIAVTLERPGYKHKFESVRAPRVRAALTERVIQMVPDSIERGSVEVKLKLAGLALSTEGGIILQGARTNSNLFLKLPRISEAPYTVAGLPCDDYTCRVGFCDRLARTSLTESGSPLMLSVLPGKSATLEVDFTKHSRVNVVLRDEFGLAYEGPATFRAVGSNGTVHHINYEAAPYCLVGFKEGAASIGATRGRSGSAEWGEEEFQARTEIAEGGVQDLVINSRFQKRVEVR